MELTPEEEVQIAASSQAIAEGEREVLAILREAILALDEVPYLFPDQRVAFAKRYEMDLWNLLVMKEPLGDRWDYSEPFECPGCGWPWPRDRHE